LDSSNAVDQDILCSEIQRVIFTLAPHVPFRLQMPLNMG